MPRLIPSPPTPLHSGYSMSQCNKKCAHCPVTITVLVEGSDDKNNMDRRVVDLHKTKIAHVFSIIANLPENRNDDMAIILRIDGHDVDLRCAHQESDIELF